MSHFSLISGILVLRAQELPAFSTIQGKTVMRMTPEAFHTWSQRLQLSAETEALIASIRSSPPARRPSGRAGNITGRYPSPKMGVSIQFESDRVEFWAMFGMERDAVCALGAVVRADTPHIARREPRSPRL